MDEFASIVYPSLQEYVAENLIESPGALVILIDPFMGGRSGGHSSKIQYN